MYDTIIIGAGPAGLSAALYCGRYRLNTLILEKAGPGGQITMSPTIENYPGFPGGISTLELVDRFTQQVTELGLTIQNQEVGDIQEHEEPGHKYFVVHTNEQQYQTRSIIVATGAHWKRLGVPGEERLVGRGVSYCATCDAPLFRNKEVVVVGGGDKAIEEAIFLSKYAAKVTVIHRRKTLRATEILQEQIHAIPRIHFLLESRVEEIVGDNRIEAVMVKNTVTNELVRFNCQGVFIFIGIRPNTQFLKSIVTMDEAGFIITDNTMHTSRPGIFSCGDCREKNLYQVIASCGEGASAAHSVHAYIMNNPRTK